MRKTIILASVALLGAAFGVRALAGGDGGPFPLAKPERQVTFNACPQPAVEGGCLLIVGKDKASGKMLSYSFGSSNGEPKVGYLGIQGEGDVDGQVNICQQGIPLHVTKWSYTKMKCK